MKPLIKHFQPAAEYFFREGCHIAELHNDAADPTLSIARARLTPGTITRWHSIAATDERYVIVGGGGSVEVGDEPAREVGAGDVVIIPAGCRQRIRNTGSDDLIFLALCTPRFVAENYLDLEAGA